MRMRTLSREFYIPKHYDTKVVPKGILAEIYLINDTSSKRAKDPLYIAIGFGGKRSAPDFHFIFKTDTRRAEYVDKYINNLKSRADEKSERKAKSNAFEHTLKVDDILYASWGYDQTNIDFYQVTKLVGKKSVKLRRIYGGKVETENDHPSADYVIARKDDFMEGERHKEKLKRVQEGNSIRIASYAHATPWDGTPKYQTALGWGH